MNRNFRIRFLFKSIFLLGTSSLGIAQSHHPKCEMRAVWIATVENMDWPSDKGLSVDRQKQEMIELLDRVKAYNMNTVVFQIRPDADALYDSKLEPWSEWLSGKQGTAPDPYYDPLAFTITECRKRGLDIHVWLNPYRAIQNIAKTIAAPDHVSVTHPEWLLTYGDQKYFDPGIPEVRNHVARVVSDLVRRYDIDAVHFDDYFYPYRIANHEFPDENSFATFPNGFAPDKKDDWRRNNVDLIIKQLHDSIRFIKPNVEFGISPFGVWKNNRTDPAGSATKAGVTNYDDLYANILLWQKEGWIDYVTPQLYWYIGKKVADYAVLVDWWSKNTYGCPLYIGQAPFLIRSKSHDPAWRTSNEIIKQIRLNRTYKNVGGSIFFNATSLRKNPLGVKANLLKDVFRYPALTPPNPHLVAIKPCPPEQACIRLKNRTFELNWQGGDNNRMFVVYRCHKKSNLNIEDPENIIKVTIDTSMEIKMDKKTNPSTYNYVVTAISSTHIESEPVIFEGE